MDVDHEISLLKEEIRRLGQEKDGLYTVKFGVLFKYVLNIIFNTNHTLLNIHVLRNRL